MLKRWIAGLGGRSFLAINIGAVLFGFRVEKVTDLPDVHGRLWRMTYERNGADLVWLERDDEVKTFVIAFKTLPENDTGVAHILEHSVLCGSRKYPVKSPFDELRKSSLCVYMNASTWRDKTAYPFSTRNDTDFLNLADVYLDAVFHPRSLTSPMAFRQEGWHDELDPKTGDLSWNGVVYNEMKGVFAEPERRARREVMRYLYPDTVYGFDSGGWPSAIPTLTYDAYRAFYEKYYHPSNARIFLDGRVALQPILEKLDTFLRDFDCRDPIPPIPLQKPVARSVTVPYESTNTVRRTILVDGWSTGSYRDLVLQNALDILSDYLCDSNEAPLPHALLAKGLCDDVVMTWSNYQQLPVLVIVRNTTDEQAETCRATIRSTLAELAEKGLDRTRLRALIDRSEFAAREMNSGRPRGLSFFSIATSTWLYGGDPAAPFDLTGLYAALRNGVETGYFERVIRDALLDNPHHVALTYSPNATYAAEKARAEAAAQEARKARMGREEREALARDLALFKQYQTTDDTPEARATIPVLRVGDIPEQGRTIPHTLTRAEGVTRIRTRTTCDGIAYLNLYFPIDGLGTDELPAIPLFARIHGEVGTSRHAALALQTALAATVGRLTVTPVAAEKGNYLKVSLAALTAKFPEAVALMGEILFETRYGEEIAAIERIRKQRVNGIEREAASRGDDLATSYAAKGWSRRWASYDLLRGYGQLRWHQSATADEALARRFQAFARRIFVRDGLIVSLTDNLSPEDEAAVLARFAPGNGTMTVAASLPLAQGEVAGIRLNGDAGYAGVAVPLPKTVPYAGPLCVAAKILSRGYLHKAIREIGGAYGTGMRVYPSGLVECYTYRDPSPVSSIETIRGVGAGLRAFAASGEALDRTIIATVASLDPFLSPSAEASRVADLLVNGRTLEDVEQLRREVLATSREDLLAFAETLEALMPKAAACVVGGAKQLAPLDPAKTVPVSSR